MRVHIHCHLHRALEHQTTQSKHCLHKEEEEGWTDSLVKGSPGKGKLLLARGCKNFFSCFLEFTVDHIMHSVTQTVVASQLPLQVVQNIFVRLCKMGKFARLDLWGRAQVVALCGEGFKPTYVCKRVKKTDGKRPTPRAIRDCMKMHKADPEWRDVADAYMSEEEMRLMRMWHTEDDKAPSEIAKLLHRSKSSITRHLFVDGMRKRRVRRFFAVNPDQAVKLYEEEKIDSSTRQSEAIA